MAYRAEIQIAVKGARQLDEVQTRLKTISDLVDKINLRTINIAGKSQKNLQNYARQLNAIEQSITAAELANDKKVFDEKRRQLRVLEQQTVRINKSSVPAPYRGRAGAPEAAGRRGGNVLVGAAFPALFGAGPAGILGGAIGEAFGPLGGVVGSALGAPVDAFVAKTVEAGQALNSTSSALDFVRERSLFSSKATEELAYQLEELGDVEGVAKLLTEELVEKIGNNGVQALQDLGKESDETTRLWNELTLQLQTLIAGPLTDFLKIVNQVLGSMTTRGRFEALQSDLAGNQEFQTEVNRLRTQRGRGARQGALTIEDMQGLINQFAPTVPKTAKIDITQQDRRDFAVKDKKQADDAARAAGELFRLNAQITSERIRQLDIGTRYRQLIYGETEGLRQQNERLNDRRDLQIQQIEQERAQALQRNKYAENETAINELYDKRIETVKGEIALTQQQNLRRLELLDIEREITNQQRERAMMRELTAVDRSIERTGLRAQSPFGGDEQERQLQLLDQRIRREDSLQQFLERKAALEAEIRRLPEQATTEIDNLKERIKREEALQVSLQQRFEILDQLEQAELRQAQIVEKYGFIADEVATAMSSAVMAVVTGTGTVEEAFATMFQNIGKAFIDMATQMLAQQLFMTVLKALGSGISGGFSSTGYYNPMTGLGTAGPNFGLADGGTVMPGNTYMVGERGPELLQLNPNGSGQVINNNQLSSAMNRYRRSGTTSTNESAAMMQGGEGGTAVLDKPIDVRYTVDRINNVDYVTAAQFQAGMQQAAQQGAQRGEQQTLKRLQMSSSTRKRLGI